MAVTARLPGRLWGITLMETPVIHLCDTVSPTLLTGLPFADVTTAATSERSSLCMSLGWKAFETLFITAYLC